VTGPRFYKKIGLGKQLFLLIYFLLFVKLFLVCPVLLTYVILKGFKTPQTAITASYVDNKCPFTSDVSIRGRIFKGVVLSNKMARTVILRRDYLHYIKKYNRFEKRHHNLPAHLSPAFARTRIGDIVTVG
jgi:ribosomal protein S17